MPDHGSHLSLKSNFPYKKSTKVYLTLSLWGLEWRLFRTRTTRARRERDLRACLLRVYCRQLYHPSARTHNSIAVVVVRVLCYRRANPTVQADIDNDSNSCADITQSAPTGAVALCSSPQDTPRTGAVRLDRRGVDRHNHFSTQQATPVLRLRRRFETSKLQTQGRENARDWRESARLPLTIPCSEVVRTLNTRAHAHLPL